MMFPNDPMWLRMIKVLIRLPYFYIWLWLASLIVRDIVRAGGYRKWMNS